MSNSKNNEHKKNFTITLTGKAIWLLPYRPTLVLDLRGLREPEVQLYTLMSLEALVAVLS